MMVVIIIIIYYYYYYYYYYYVIELNEFYPVAVVVVMTIYLKN
jgi:hypothetical protein